MEAVGQIQVMLVIEHMLVAAGIYKVDKVVFGCIGNR